MTQRPAGPNELPLNDAINRQLAQEMLDARQLQQLMGMQQAVLDDGADHAGRNGRRLWLSGMAVCATLVLSIVLAWQTIAPSSIDYTQDIALEVVQNHLKLKPLDISSDSMSEIQGFFTQLDFSPVSSGLLASRFALSEQSMLGGRYCSIKGITAAQLRYRRGADDLSTLYEVAYDSSAFGPMPSIDQGESPRELFLKGLKVSLWVEKGLLMVLVTEA